MVRTTPLLAAALPLVAAWPGVMEINEKMLNKRLVQPPPRDPVFLSGRTNTGSNGPALGFDAADQYVDVSEGSGHEYQAPGPSDLRGQCPGLNAAANHGFTPRNGISTVLQCRITPIFRVSCLLLIVPSDYRSRSSVQHGPRLGLVLFRPCRRSWR